MLCRKCPMSEATLFEGHVILLCKALNYRPVGSFISAKCKLTWDDVSQKPKGDDNACLEWIQNPMPNFGMR